ncbi:hypothetical protein PIROE2DRAFT_60358 [Piromyces sp. E2]|nr:hypothetical protein PIROE2DRAFT_60358 [Piromyces sp. E2]|eukprot:OUM64880.1 hypothetical protein PIROE2DRAFT_60358 [Piromyces sp. E2]
MKKIHQLKQWTNEKVGRAKKTEMDEELKQLIQETDLQREYFDRLQKTLGDYIHIYDKRVDTQEEKKIQPVNAIGLLTINFGTIYPVNSAFGQALLKYGEGHTKLSEIQTDFVNHSRRGFENYLAGFGAEMKNYSALKKKFDHRRLDLDEIQSRVKKSSKEKPQLVQDLRVSQDKYEESLDELTKKIFDLNNCNNKHLESLKEFCLSELEYHRNAVDILTDVYNSIVDLKEDDSVSYDAYASALTSNPSTYDQGNSYVNQSNSYNSYSRKSSYSSYQNSYDVNRSSSNSSSYSPISQIRESPSVQSSIINQAPASIPRQQTVQSPQRYLRQVRANFDFTAEASNELSMKAGDIINVIKEIDEGWWQGEMADGSGRSGIFPQNYTSEVSPPIPSRDSYDNSVNDVTQSMANTNIGYRKPSVSSNNSATVRKTSMTSELQQRMAAGGGSRMVTSPVKQNTGGSNNVGACSTCGCDDYALNVFKPPLCNNCFHNH